MADLQIDQLTTTHTAALDTDLIVVKKPGGATGKMTRAVALADVPRLLSSPVISGNGIITAASHANRLVRVTSAASCTVDPAGWADGDEVMFRQDGGVLTLTGSNITLLPGIASATTNGDGTFLVCQWRSQDSKFLVFHRNAAAASGGGGVTVVQDLATHAAAGASGASETLVSLTMPAIAAGGFTEITGHVQVGAETADNVTLSVVWGGSTIELRTLGAGIGHLSFSIRVFHRATNVQLVKPWAGLYNMPNSTTPGDAAVNTASTSTLSVVVNRVSNARSVTLEAFRAEIR